MTLKWWPGWDQPYERNPADDEVNTKYFDGGVPKSIDVLSPVPSANRPCGSDTYTHADDHLRACYAMIAQLRDRVESLERAKNLTNK